MNPFSGFLQPQNNRPLQGLATTQDVLRTVQGNKELAQRQLENTQQNDRANQRLGMEQAYQSRKFSQEDQKQVEALLAEYQEAEDQGDPVRLSRAAQMLQRFGMDVGQGGQKPDLAAFTGQQKPDLRALTGERTLPNVAARPSAADLQALTGQPQNPIDEAVAQEMKSREALMAKNAAPEQDLSQEDFESQLIEGSGKLPERMEKGGETTPEMKALLPQAPEEEVRDMGDVDSPEFQQAAAQEGTNGNVMDLDADDPTPLRIGGPEAPQSAQVAQPAPQGPPRRLSTQLLPTVISKGGKQLYESTGPSGRWAPMVSGVFDQFTQHENPGIASAAKRAQVMASKLISVDGIAPKEAVSIGMNYLNGEANRIINLERTKLGSRPRFGGGAGGGLMGKGQDIAESVQLYDDNARAEAAKIQEEDRQYESIEGAIHSSDPALQRDAVNQLLKIRSGTAVTAAEDARISQINGLIAQVQDRLGRWTGGAMTPEMARTIQQIVALKRQVSQAKIKRIYDHQAEVYKAQNTGKVKDPAVLEQRATVLRKGGLPAGEVAEEDLY